MVQLIVGKKGTGKTKRLLGMIADAQANSKGHVVCIERGDSLKFDITHKVRLIDIKEYAISGPDAYYGFFAGLLSGNYDITEIFADATFRILCGDNDKDFELLARFVERLSNLTKDSNVVITMGVSCEISELPERIHGMIMNK